MKKDLIEDNRSILPFCCREISDVLTKNVYAAINI